MSFKTIAVIPVHGRLPLLKVTINRLYEKNKIDKVICIGNKKEQQICEDSGAEFHIYSNNPLGKKWNYGFRIAKEYSPDAVLYVGSSDWLSNNWLPVLIPFIERGYAIAGKFDYNLLHISDRMNLTWFPHYPKGSGRENELIGIGRLLSREFLDAIDWMPFDDYLNKSMDYSMWIKLGNLQKKGMKLLPYAHNLHEIQSLSVSCDLWTNLHNSNGTIPLSQSEGWLKIWFPEALKLNLYDTM